MDIEFKNVVDIYKAELNVELNEILNYWVNNTVDTEHGGFVGAIDENNNVIPNAPKSAILYSRLLWAFSSAYSITKQPTHLQFATMAFEYLQANFIDKKQGGIFWMLNANATVLENKKQVYALAFALYGLSAYYNATNNILAKQTAIALFECIEIHSFDVIHTGYLEAFSVDWQPIVDVRLSSKDVNEKKTMNTHLHVLEAYTLLYKIWPNQLLKTRINQLLKNFTQFFIDNNTFHLHLFFTDDWQLKSNTISFGHDIEAAWLLVKAAEVINDAALLHNIQTLAKKITAAAVKGIDVDNGMWYEFEKSTGITCKQKHWWVQAEAMVGFFNGWQISGQHQYLQQSMATWEFVKNAIKDHHFGEWYWGVDEQGQVMKNQDKVGVWKCPYHNTRACIEIINGINALN
jgi:cellobiose epimerase